MDNIDIYQKIKSMNNIHTTWRDYCLMLLNSTNDSDGLRSNWRNKLITSIIHTKFFYNIVSESTYTALEVMSELPSDFTQKVVDDSWEYNEWSFSTRIPGSKKMRIRFSHYPQESITNEVLECFNYILDNWDEYNYLIFDNPRLKKIWDLSQDARGDCLYPDEVLTYSLEKDLSGNAIDDWVNASYDVFLNGKPSDKYKKWWVSDKKENFPFKRRDLENQFVKRYFKNVLNIYFKEDIRGCPSWKRICICILKIDRSFKYAGFTPGYKERLVREEAMATFSIKQEEKEKAKKNILKLIQNIDKEKDF